MFLTMGVLVIVVAGKTVDDASWMWDVSTIFSAVHCDLLAREWCDRLCRTRETARTY